MLEGAFFIFQLPIEEDQILLLFGKVGKIFYAGVGSALILHAFIAQLHLEGGRLHVQQKIRADAVEACKLRNGEDIRPRLPDS